MVFATTTTAVDGAFTAGTSALADGTYTATARETDGAGNDSSATTTFTIDLTAPTIVVVTPETDAVETEREVVITGFPLYWLARAASPTSLRDHAALGRVLRFPPTP